MVVVARLPQHGTEKQSTSISFSQENQAGKGKTIVLFNQKDVHADGTPYEEEQDEKLTTEQTVKISSSTSTTTSTTSTLAYRKHLVAFYLNYALIGFIGKGLLALIYPWYTNFLGYDGYQSVTATELITFPWCCKWFLGALSDRFPLYRGFRRVPYMLVGWSFCLIFTVTLICLPSLHSVYDPPSFLARNVAEETSIHFNNTSTILTSTRTATSTSTAATSTTATAATTLKMNSTAEAKKTSYLKDIHDEQDMLVFVYLMLLMGISLGYIIVKVASDGMLVEMTQKKETWQTRGSLQTWSYIVIRAFGTLSECFIGFFMNDQAYGGSFAFALSFRQVMIVFFAVMLVVVPWILYNLQDERVHFESHHAFIPSFHATSPCCYESNLTQETQEKQTMHCVSSSSPSVAYPSSPSPLLHSNNCCYYLESNSSNNSNSNNSNNNSSNNSNNNSNSNNSNNNSNSVNKHIVANESNETSTEKLHELPSIQYVTIDQTLNATKALTHPVKTKAASHRWSYIRYVWQMLKQRIIWQVLLYKFMAGMLSSFQATPAPIVQRFWARVEPYQLTICGVMGNLVFIFALFGIKCWGLQWNWRFSIALATMIIVMLDSIVSFCTIFNVYRSPWFWLGLPMLEEFPRAVRYLVSSFVIVEVAPVGSEALTYGLITTMDHLADPFASTLYKSIDGCFDVYLHDIQADSHETRKQVAWTFGIMYVAKLASLVFLVFLPSQKQHVQELKRSTRQYPWMGSLMLIVALAAFTWSLIISVLTILPATQCLKIVGGPGCFLPRSEA